MTGAGRAPYLRKNRLIQTLHLVESYKTVHIMLQNENYLTKRKKRAIVASINRLRRRYEAVRPAQREPFRGCKKVCQGGPRLPLPSRATKEEATGPPVTEATSGSVSLQAGWNRGIQTCIPPLKSSGVGFYLCPPQKNRRQNHERRKSVHL